MTVGMHGGSRQRDQSKGKRHISSSQFRRFRRHFATSVQLGAVVKGPHSVNGFVASCCFRIIAINVILLD